MALHMSRLGTFPDIGTGDQDQDPNSALLELDRSLKSSKIGEQCEAISRFPALFEKFPFPILINSALLKLADVFRQEIPGSNFVRVCVVEVIESSGKHLDKLINIEEFLKRISAVMHSNDPMARALTLKTLAWMSDVIGENRSVHHSIRDALESKDSVELQAAIFASEKYAAKSKQFAMSMCERLTSMISGLATPVDVKLQLIQVFQHMHHDAETAATVRALCLKLLREHPTQRVAITTLHTLTELAAHCLVDIPQQVDLLMDCLQSEPRLGVRKSILEELDYLAQAAPHAWETHNLETLTKFTQSSLENTLVSSRSLDVLSSLIAAPTSPNFSTLETLLVDLCNECIYGTDLKIAGKGLQLSTNLALYKSQEQGNTELVEEALDNVVDLLQCVVTESSSHLGNLRTCLLCAAALAKNAPEKVNPLLETMLTTLMNQKISDQGRLLICEGLASLGATQPGVLSGSLPQLFKVIKQLTGLRTLSSKQSMLMNTLVTLLLQTYHSKEWCSLSQNAVLTASESVDLWTCFKIARQATRYGHHALAQGLYSSLTGQICSEQKYFFVLALSQLSEGEAMASQSGDRADNLNAANFHLHRSLTSLKAANSPGQSLEFCQQYVKLRAETMINHAQLIHSCLALRTAPPPAIAAVLATSSSRNDELLRCGRVATQLTKSATDFKNIADKYSVLHQTSFDADMQTLCNLALLKEGALLMAKSIELIVRPTLSTTPQEFVIPDLTNIMKKPCAEESIESKSMLNSLVEASSLGSRLAQVCLELKPIREQHLDLLQGVSKMLTAMPLPYPRFFFQRLQKTSLALNVLPQPRISSESIVVQTSEQLTIKVEGVIVNARKAFLFRSVESVILTLNSQMINRPAHTLDIKVEPNETMVQTVKPHNDFFSAQFLLGFAIPGIYQVSIAASVMDTEDDIWKTGPCHTLSIKAQELNNQRPASQQGPSQSGPFPVPRPAGVDNLSHAYTAPSRGVI